MKKITIPVLNLEGVKVSERDAGAEFFGLSIQPVLISQAVKKYLSNQRKSLAKAKTRSEVAGSGAKIWRQKGTGRARHGNRKAPLFVGGGVAHGPTGTQNYKQKLSKKMGRKAVLEILSERLKNKKLFLVNKFEIKSTKEAYCFVEKVRGNLKIKKISLVQANEGLIKRYFGNLDNFNLLEAGSLNSSDLLRNEVVIFTDEALSRVLEIFKEG